MIYSVINEAIRKMNVWIPQTKLEIGLEWLKGKQKTQSEFLSCKQQSVWETKNGWRKDFELAPPLAKEYLLSNLAGILTNCIYLIKSDWINRVWGYTQKLNFGDTISTVAQVGLLPAM